MKTIESPADRAELLARLRALSPSHAARWGRMTPHQMLCHVADTCRMTLGERAVAPVGNAVSRTIIRFVALHTPAPIPKGQRAAPELDAQRGGTPPTEFAADRCTLEALLDRCAADATIDGREHTFFGRLTRREWGRFHYKHLDHHLRQFGA